MQNNPNQNQNPQFVNNSSNPYQNIIPPYNPPPDDSTQNPIMPNGQYTPQSGQYQHPNVQYQQPIGQYPPQNAQYPSQNNQYPPYQQQAPPISQSSAPYQQQTPPGSYQQQYPPQNGQHQQPYPPQNQYQPSYPPQSNQYQQQTPPGSYQQQYPPQNNQYQQQTPPGSYQQQYPPQNGQHQQPYPPQNGQYQPSYPPQNDQYQQQTPPGSYQQQYPPQNGQHQQPYPPQNGQYQPSYPPQNNQYQQQTPPGSYQQQYPPQQEPLVDGPCTFNLTGTTMANQPFYNCITCGLVDGLGCCEACARICHQGHQLVAKGRKNCYCDCGEGKTRTCVQCKCRKVTASQAQLYSQYEQNTLNCTYLKTGPKMVKQTLYRCNTCRFSNDTCMCENCAKVCHYGHDVRPLGVIDGYCDCGAGGTPVRCKCMNGAAPRSPAGSGDDCNLQ